MVLLLRLLLQLLVGISRLGLVVVLQSSLYAAGIKVDGDCGRIGPVGRVRGEEDGVAQKAGVEGHFLEGRVLVI